MKEFLREEDAKLKHWYTKVNNRETGPYRYVELLLMINNKDITENDFVTFRGSGGWKPLSDFDNFLPGNVKNSLEEQNVDPEDSADIHFRRAMRVPLKNEVLLVGGEYCFKSMCMDVSTGGCLLKVSRGKIRLDSNVKIHIYEDKNKNFPSFNFIGEAVRVFSADKVEEDSNLYDLVGIKFLETAHYKKSELREALRNMVFNTIDDEDIVKIMRRDKALAA